MRSVLIVDDSDGVRAAIRGLFADCGWSVIEAKNGLQAVEAAQKFLPDVIVLDVAMPVMDGIRAAQLLMHKMPDARIIMCSLYATDESINQEIYRAGIRNVVMKSDACRHLVRIAEKLVTQPPLPEQCDLAS
jgi:CheY-like chemotaxis protein